LASLLAQIPLVRDGIVIMRRYPLLVALLADELVQQTGDLLHTGGGAVEPTAHLSEPAINLGKAALHSRAQIRQVFAHRVETGHGGLPEVANLSPDLLYVAVSAAG